MIKKFKLNFRIYFINRQEHQEVRGGGTVCRQSVKISQLYRSTIKDVEPCRKVSQKNYIEVDIEIDESSEN